MPLPNEGMQGGLDYNVEIGSRTTRVDYRTPRRLDTVLSNN
ncbi:MULTISPECIES: hypothetical protein [unclassified Bradyrhizobium]|nr:hypothetical protein [Bradyrhizobium sp. USDA 4538]MCP1899048.1 hypothetical protein [Bradyrhizobium sp. USDA 4537]MCP1986839.1 hypothetical protein [Bradyrhizobium sp. USDA 4539]